jgi:ergothioneine biosynthesis protein EgtB
MDYRTTERIAPTRPNDCWSHAARANLIASYRAVRGVSHQLCQPLSAEDCQSQSMEDASPTKWHLAHTSWFFETFVLEPVVPRYKVFNEQFRVLFNSYYQSVGDQHPRPRRGLLTRPSLDEVRDYRHHVDRHLLDYLEAERTDPQTLDIVEIGLHHEQQHQELILTDIKHLLAANPIQPVYRQRNQTSTTGSGAVAWSFHSGGLERIGDDGEGFAFDNERPRHRVVVEPYELSNQLVTNRDFLEFIADRGYDTPTLWLSDGWSVVQQRGWRAPLYWQERDGEWRTFTLSGAFAVGLDEPVCHVSLYEADAFARWAGARLPTEAEWELAAGGAFKDGNFLETGLLHPRPRTKQLPAREPCQFFGDVWEWTSSAYAPYPGYNPPPGALGEYNGKFMSGQTVLRGGSCVTPRSHIRATYRNFFPPDARWQFSGVRLARDRRSS